MWNGPPRDPSPEEFGTGPPVPALTGCFAGSLQSPREASCLHMDTFSHMERRESSRGQDSVLRDGGCKARADSCTSQTLFLEKNSLLPPTWSSFLESCPSVYVLKTSLHVCCMEPGTEAWRKHGLQTDREEGCKEDSGQNLVSFQLAQSQNRGPQPAGPRKKSLLAQYLLTSCGAAGRVTRLC